LPIFIRPILILAIDITLNSRDFQSIKDNLLLKLKKKQEAHEYTPRIDRKINVLEKRYGLFSSR